MEKSNTRAALSPTHMQPTWMEYANPNHLAALVSWRLVAGGEAYEGWKGKMSPDRRAVEQQASENPDRMYTG